VASARGDRATTTVGRETAAALVAWRLLSPFHGGAFWACSFHGYVLMPLRGSQIANTNQDT